MDIHQVKLIYVGKDKESELQEFYNLLGLEYSLTSDQIKRLDELKGIYRGNAIVLSDVKLSDEEEKSRIRDQEFLNEASQPGWMKIEMSEETRSHVKDIIKEMNFDWL